MKILAMYLPQYHQIPENDRWWGEGYTEWTAVKNAMPLYKDHYQPRIPLNDNYYDLSDKEAKAWKWQADLAREYGVDGFCVYHYWFKDKQLLEKPLEILLEHKEIDIEYSICWANESWTKTWYGLDTEILAEQLYGNKEDWLEHFNYLLKFFKDPRYIKIDNKPIVHIYRSSHIKELEEMLSCWNSEAKKEGFDGVYIIAANNGGELENREELIDAYYDFEPMHTLNHRMNRFERLSYGSKIWFKMMFNKIFNTKILERTVDAEKIVSISKRNVKKRSKPVYKGTFPMWDNTPRRSYKGMVFKKANPDLFRKSLLQIRNHSDFIYINAWNEWGEGCYLEPDSYYKFEYLKVIKDVLGDSNEK